MWRGITATLGGAFHNECPERDVDAAVQMVLACLVPAIKPDPDAAAALAAYTPAGQLAELELSLATAQGLTLLSTALLQYARLAAGHNQSAWRVLASSWPDPGRPRLHSAIIANRHLCLCGPGPPSAGWLTEVLVFAGVAVQIRKQMEVALRQSCRVPAILQERTDRILQLSLSGASALSEIIMPLLQHGHQASMAPGRGWRAG